MSYFIFKCEWSQTDSEFVVVQATSREEAEKHLRRNGNNGPRYITFYQQVDSILDSIQKAG